MILFEVNARGEVKSTPSRIPQGLTMASIVVMAEADYALVTMKIIPPSGDEIPDIVCCPVKTEGKTIWRAILPAEAAEMSGNLTYQIFLHGKRTVAERQDDGSVEYAEKVLTFASDEGRMLVSKGVISDMPETLADLEKYSIGSLYKLLVEINGRLVDNEKELEVHHEEIYGEEDADHTAPSRIDVLEAARPVTGEITINTSEWNKIEGGYSVFKKLATDVVREGDVILIIPDDDASRVASADVAVRVNSLVYEQTLEDVLVFMSALEPKVDLCYRYIVVRRGADDENTQANAIIIGVNDVPQYVKDKISSLETWKEMADAGISKNAEDIAKNTSAIEALRETVANLDASAGLTPEQVQDIVAEALPKAPTSIDLTALDPVEQEDGRLMGYIVETFGEEDGAPTETTELTYDDAGNIVSIKTADGHETKLYWKEAE